MCALVVVAGCWSDEPLVDGELTPAQLAEMRAKLTLPDIDACKGIANCAAAARLGQDLFFEPALSHDGQLACVTCHDPKAWFIDTRTPNNLSLGADGWTHRNAMATVNLAVKSDLGGEFTWSGGYKTPGEVMDLALPHAMGTSTKTVATLISSSSYYASEYATAFDDADVTIANAELAMTAYLRRVSSLDSAFDHYIAGDDDALTEAAKRGFGVFVGRGTCIECHRNPALSDFEYHVTGVSRVSDNEPMVDVGRAKVTKHAADEGKFLTPPLRDVARTAPYMHNGSLPSLEMVVDFYRRGGDTSGYAGTKDPRIQQLEITDQDAADLVTFLGSLNGSPVAEELTVDLRPFRNVCGDLQVCDGLCVDTQTDPRHCGSCDHECTGGRLFVGGTRVASTCMRGVCGS